MLDIQAELIKLISTLPAGENPYEVLRTYLWGLMVPDVPKTFRGHLIFVLVVLALCLVLVIGSLVVRVWQKTFWIAHLGTSPRLIRPHFSISWSLWAVVLLILLLASIGETIQYYFGGRVVQRGFIAWMTFIWLPAWYGGFTAAWSIAVSFLLHLHTYGHIEAVEDAAPIVNTCAFVIPAVYSVVIVPVAGLASYHFSRAMGSFKQLDDLLVSNAATYSGSFNIMELMSGLPILQKMEHNFERFLRFMRITFALFAVTGFVLVGLLATVALLYLFSLRDALNLVDNLSRSTTSSRESRRKLMSRTYTNLLVTVIAFTLLGLLFSITCILIANDPAGLAKPALAQCFHLIPFYAFAVLGLPTATLLFIRSFDNSSPLLRTSSPSNGNTSGKAGRRPSCGGGSGSGAGAGEVSVSVHVVCFAEPPLTPPSRQPSHSRRSTSVPYAHARAAFAMPVPAGFEMVDVVGEKTGQEEEKKEQYRASSSSDGGHEALELVHVGRSPGFAPESPMVGRWSYAAESGSSRFSSPRQASSRPFSDMSLADSMGAENGSVAAFSFGATTRLDSPVGSPLREETSAGRRDSEAM